jgi:hypothetical protein
MIRIVGHGKEGQKFVLLGVDRENINRLTSGKPIFCKGSSIGLEFDISIIFAETLQELSDQLAAGGMTFPKGENPQ